MIKHNPEEDILEDSEELIESESERRQSEKEHFASTYTLKPNENYDANGYSYETDKLGRITRCEGILRLEDGKRNTAHQIRAGGEYRLENDEGGHLIGRRFGGSEKVDNLVPMDSHVNGVEYKKLEDDWAAELNKGSTVDVKIQCRYFGDSTRPTDFIVKYKITDNDEFTRNETKRIRIHNQEGGK